MSLGLARDNPAVIAYAWQLVDEYVKHQRGQDKLHRKNHRPKNGRQSGMMYFGDKRKSEGIDDANTGHTTTLP